MLFSFKKTGDRADWNCVIRGPPVVLNCRYHVTVQCGWTLFEIKDPIFTLLQSKVQIFCECHNFFFKSSNFFETDVTKNVKSNWEIFYKFLCHSQNIWTLSKYFVKKQECSSFFVYSSNRLNLAFSKTNSCFLKIVLQNNSIQNITLQTLTHTAGSKSFIIRIWFIFKSTFSRVFFAI